MYIDSHCHLADETFVADLDEVAQRAHAAGVNRAVCILSADTAEEHARIEAVRAAWPAVVFATAIHPHRAAAYAGRVSAAVQAVRDVAARVSAPLLGEMGLDYHYDFAPRAETHDRNQQRQDQSVAIGHQQAIPTEEEKGNPRTVDLILIKGRKSRHCHRDRDDRRHNDRDVAARFPPRRHAGGYQQSQCRQPH
jgi:TatD DNase family protein